MVVEITFAKGGITVTIHCSEVNDNFANKLFIITPAQSTSNQEDGTKTPKIVDLLRVTHQIILRGHLTGTASKTALAVKRDLVNIWKGAGTAGGVVTMTYDQGASAIGDTSATSAGSITGFIEKVNFKDESHDQPSNFESAPEDYQEVSRYEITLTFIEGTNI